MIIKMTSFAFRSVMDITNSYLSYFAEWILGKTEEITGLSNKLYNQAMTLDH